MTMTKARNTLITVEAALAGVAGLTAIVSVFWRNWLEVLFRWDPDRHNGTAEILIIVGLASFALLLGCAARWQTLRWSRPAALPAGSV